MKLALVVLLLATAPARADNQFWDSVTAQVRQAKDAGVVGWTDLQLRRRAGSTLTIVRPALGYAFTATLAVHAGYALITTNPDTGDTVNEHRLWQQALWTPALSDRWKAQLRPRLEERWAKQDDQVGFRVRVLARGQWAPSKHPFQLVVWDELFLALNNTERFRRGFDQNRLFLGAGVDTALRGVRVEVGYINVQFNAQESDHALAVNVAVNATLGD